MENFEDYELLKIYCGEIPDFIKKFAATDEMQRLKYVGMSCGCEYTAVHRETICHRDTLNKGKAVDSTPRKSVTERCVNRLIQRFHRYTRFEHSVGVALIIWNFTRDVKQSLAGLFHDISTPAFAHVVDYMNGDHMTQESTEASTADFIDSSEEIQRLLREYGLNTPDVSDYHLYPIADNETPQLSADRLEYTFGNFLQYGVTDIEHIERFYHNLTVGINEHGEQELMFADKNIAEEFALYSMKCSHVYVSDEDRFTMQYLADLLKLAADKGVVSVEDLYTSEENVIEKLEQSEVTSAKWREYCGIRSVKISSAPISDGYCTRVNAKRRYIDPYVKNIGRVTAFSELYSFAVDEFFLISFDCWMSIG